SGADTVCIKCPNGRIESELGIFDSEEAALKSHVTKGVGIRFPWQLEHAEVGEIRDWKLDAGDVRNDPRIAEEMLEFMASHGVLSVAMTDRIIGCPHQEGIDYQGEWCPVCEFWKGRDRFTGERVH